MQNKIAGMERSEEKSDKIGEQKVEMRTWAAIIIAALRAAIITSLPLPLPLPPFFMISLPLPLPLPPFFMTSLPLPLPLPWKSRAAAAVRAFAASRCPITAVINTSDTKFLCVLSIVWLWEWVLNHYGYSMIFSDRNKRTQYSSAPWHARYFCNSTFWSSIYGIYVILSTKLLEKNFKGNMQLFTTIAKFDFKRPLNHCNFNQKSRWIFFLILGGQFCHDRCRANSKKV